MRALDMLVALTLVPPARRFGQRRPDCGMTWLTSRWLMPRQGRHPFGPAYALLPFRLHLVPRGLGRAHHPGFYREMAGEISLSVAEPLTAVASSMMSAERWGGVGDQGRRPCTTVP